MRLTAQQKMTAVIFGILIMLVLGAVTFINSKSTDIDEISSPIFSTSTMSADTSSSGWWDSIPTDPVLPVMPGLGTATVMQTSIP